MMVGDDEPRPSDEWPPPTDTNKDGNGSRLLFLTVNPNNFQVQYVEGEPSASYASGLESFSELEQRVSPLDPNMGCTECYSPLIPSQGYLPVSSTPPTEEGVIVLSEGVEAQLDGAAAGPAVTDDGKLLLLAADSSQPAELVVPTDGSGDQRLELLLSNGTIAYGIVESADNNGTGRFIQIPREYLVSGRSQNSDPLEDSGQSEMQEETVQDETGHLRTLYNTLKEQGLIIELRLQDQNQQLIDQSLSLPVLQNFSNTQLSYQPPADSDPLEEPVERRYWCEECNVLMDSDCAEHQINRKISDKAVPSRARATLPASYLAINRVSEEDEEYGVFARKTIPKRTQFGPIEGVLVKSEEVLVLQEVPNVKLTIESDSGEFRTLDVSNEHMSNWMRFVRRATTERPPNLLLSQLGNSLYFTTTRMIHQKEELLVWYSPSYAVRRNLSANPPEIVWPCSTCGKKLKTAEELAKHSNCHKAAAVKKEEKLNINTLKRKNQAMVAFVKKDLTERNYFAKLKYECTICNKRFPRSFSLKRHLLLLHTRENKYHCKVCHLGFSHSYNRLRHMRKAHPNHKDNKPVKKVVHRYESWSCAHCFLTFSSKSIMNLHTLVHAADNVENSGNVAKKPEELWSCPQCSQKFTSKSKLANHVSEHGKYKRSNEYKHHCDICGKNFISSVRYQVHKELHGEEDKKPLQCNVCLRRFTTNSSLVSHLKIHSSEIQWECPICKEAFVNVLALKMHVHSHAVNGIYSCPHCHKRFDEYSHVRKHIRSFHSARNHICVDCGKCFPSQDKLRMHLLKHSDHREFLCADCGKQFKRKDKLKEHMKRMHSAEREEKKHAEKRPDKKMLSKIVVNVTDYDRYIYKCHSCMLGFKRRGMLVNHLANRHPDITPESVPELNLPILKTTRDYYCQYCDKIYKSSSKRKAHILKNHPGLELPMSNRQKGGVPEIPGLPNPTFSQTVGSVTTTPHSCQWCHKQYASKAKLLQHQRKKHTILLSQSEQEASRALKNLSPEDNIGIEKNSVTNFEKKYGFSVERPRYGVGVEKTNLEKTQNVVNSYEDDDEEADGDQVPIALTTNMSHQLPGMNQFTEYEIIATEDNTGANGILIDTSTIIKRSSYKNDNISSDLLSQAMSEIGVSLSDLRALSMLQSPGDPLYTPYPR